MEGVKIIIPVKDEEEGLQYLLSDFSSSRLGNDFDITFTFVIDCRTSDNSREVASNFSDHILDQNESHGKGAAMRQAIEGLDISNTPIIIFMDADGSYSFEAVKDVISEIISGSDVVSGSRFIIPNGKPKGMSWLHNVGNIALSKISSIRNGRKITDLCTGLWGFKSEALKKIEIKSNGFDLEAEIAGQVRRKNLLHTEVPVNWSQRKGGSSKLRSIRDGLIIFSRIIIT